MLNNVLKYGYALEIDCYDNGANDPGGNYIAIARTSAWNEGYPRLNNNYYSTTATEDNQWYSIEMYIAPIYTVIVDVSFDDDLILSDISTSDLGYGYFGFSVATSGLNNYHVIDDVKIFYRKIVYPEPFVKISSLRRYGVYIANISLTPGKLFNLGIYRPLLNNFGNSTIEYVELLIEEYDPINTSYEGLHYYVTRLYFHLVNGEVIEYTYNLIDNLGNTWPALTIVSYIHYSDGRTTSYSQV